jgi:hypothetical protein
VKERHRCLQNFDNYPHPRQKPLGGKTLLAIRIYSSPTQGEGGKFVGRIVFEGEGRSFQGLPTLTEKAARPKAKFAGGGGGRRPDAQSAHGPQSRWRRTLELFEEHLVDIYRHCTHFYRHDVLLAWRGAWRLAAK